MNQRGAKLLRNQIISCRALFARHYSSFSVADRDTRANQITADEVLKQDRSAGLFPEDVVEAKPFEQISDEESLHFFEVNVLSGVRLSRHYLPRMREKNWGRILFVSSESALQIPVEMIHYGMTKTAQPAIAGGMAETTTGTNVTVNAVLPGPTDSEGVGQFVDGLAVQKKTSQKAVEEDFFAHTRPSSIRQRFEKPEEIAAVVAFVASPLASAVNGAALRVDGGVVRSIG
jgi:NAD(P)-dependent dehydrogenase (short-subunit alcohol dehydrogenase family)